jgi:hypothetical protein
LENKRSKKQKINKLDRPLSHLTRKIQIISIRNEAACPSLQLLKEEGTAGPVRGLTPVEGGRM